MHGPSGNLSRSSSALSVSLNALLARDLGRWIYSYFIFLPNWFYPRSTSFASQTSVNNVYCPCQSESNLSFPIQPSLLLSTQNISPCRYLLRRFPCHSPVVIPGHEPCLDPPPGRRHTVQGFDSQAYARTSLCIRRRASLQAPACSLYYPLVRTGKAEMKYIADYPLGAGSLTRLDGSSGQGGYRYLAKRMTCGSVTDVFSFFYELVVQR